MSTSELLIPHLDTSPLLSFSLFVLAVSRVAHVMNKKAAGM